MPPAVCLPGGQIPKESAAPSPNLEPDSKASYQSAAETDDRILGDRKIGRAIHAIERHEPPASLPLRQLQAEPSIRSAVRSANCLGQYWRRTAQGSQSGATRLFLCMLRLPDCVALPTQAVFQCKIGGIVGRAREPHNVQIGALTMKESGLQLTH